MQQYQLDFIKLALKCDTLRFGKFNLKSGRTSPYFFNAGLFCTGESLHLLGNHYATALQTAGLEYDALFGPAYKGIPLVSATSIALAAQHNKNIPYAFNRKEVKDHGEGGQMVGADLKGQRVIIIDDVITAGTAIRESVSFLKEAGAILSGVLIALDRQERGQGTLSAIQEIEEQYDIPVISIITMQDLMSYLQQEKQLETLTNMRTYRDQYGVL
jgi:orotate phosphoribosyltransferase